MKKTKPKLAICFFGITRSLTHTINSIENNIITPAKKYGDVKIYSHFFLQNEIDNPRSGELGSYSLDEYQLLKSDWIHLEKPDFCLDSWGFKEICSFGDCWDDEFRSLRNLIHQLHSLRQVTLAVLEDETQNCIFCRPDLYYHSNIRTAIRRALHGKHARVQLPYWQGFGGYNDRFAICSGPKAIKSYGCRIEMINRFCQEFGSLHSEKLVRFALQSEKIDVRFIGTRASRVRIDGNFNQENFTHPYLQYSYVKRTQRRFRAVKNKLCGSLRIK